MPADDHFGSYAWVKRTGGVMTSGERRRALRAILRGGVAYVFSLVRFVAGRTPTELSLIVPTPPRSPLARAAEEACASQSPQVIRHSYRTWAYGHGLALLDDVSLDEELFYAACLLHDHGLEQPHAGEDFTLRSAECAMRCVESCLLAERAGKVIADAIAVHVTPGIRPTIDPVLGCYVQAGSMLDLSGLRAGELSRSYRRDVADAHPRAGVTAFFIDLVRAEAAANPHSRFGLLNRCGITLTFRLNPLRPR